MTVTYTCPCIRMAGMNYACLPQLYVLSTHIDTCIHPCSFPSRSVVNQPGIYREHFVSRRLCVETTRGGDVLSQPKPACGVNSLDLARHLFRF